MATVTAVVVPCEALDVDQDGFSVLRNAGVLRTGVVSRVLRQMDDNGTGVLCLEGYKDGTIDPPRTIAVGGAYGERMAQILDPDFDPRTTLEGKWLGAMLFGKTEARPDVSCTVVTSEQLVPELEAACALRGLEFVLPDHSSR